MPTEVGELEAMRVPSLAVTGLQHNVIVMALCCKKGGGQHIKGVTATAKATRIAWYCRITVLRRDWVVVAGADLRHDYQQPS